MGTVYLIGIAGGSGSGKTTLAQKLSEKLEASLIHLDDYRDLTVPLERLGKFDNFDLPKYYNFDLLYHHLLQIKEGRSIFAPKFHKLEQKITSQIIKPTKNILIEGIYLFWDKSVRDLINYKIFLECSPEVMILRRAQRARTPEGEYYQEVMIPQFFKFCLPQKEYADCSISTAQRTINEVVDEAFKISF